MVCLTTTRCWCEASYPAHLMERSARDIAVLQARTHSFDMMAANRSRCFAGRWCSLAEVVEQLGVAKRIFLPAAGQSGSQFVLKVDRSPMSAQEGVQAESSGLSKLSRCLGAAGQHAAAARLPFTTQPFQLNFTKGAGVLTLYAVLQERLQGALFKCTKVHTRKLDKLWIGAFAHASLRRFLY